MDCKRILVLHALFIMLHYHICNFKSIVEASNVHIVYLGERSHENPAIVAASHIDMLSTLLGSKEAARASILYSYKHAFSGFAATLTKSQVEKLEKFPGIVRVIPNTMYKLHTTWSWDFLGLHSQSPHNLLSESNMGEGVIIGVIDSGIWPESPSFDDTGMSPIPSRWKGICQNGQFFNSSHCNKKLIGARYFTKGLTAEMEREIKCTKGAEYLSPRDAKGHGTHAASTAAGNFVDNASYKGLALGVARGGAPHAHLAIYKVCWAVPTEHCSNSDILKAMDMAVRDGVDVISVPLGQKVPFPPYIDNECSIGSFHAMAKGISVVFSAGNDGPISQTVDHGEPWAISVAASTIDRAFPTAIFLGNNHTLLEQSISTEGYKDGFHGLTYSASCSPESLNTTLVEGKVILCFSSAAAAESVSEAGGIGVIYAHYQHNLLHVCDKIPCIRVNYEMGTEILSYIRNTRFPIVKLGRPASVNGKWVSRRIAQFSSRGPSSLSPSVLKPDIAAPGVSILAASVKRENANDAFVFMSGTSMACPHVTGIVALIKSVHPDWSPAAIKSALITTALQTSSNQAPIVAEDGTRKIADPFDFGGGHVNPNKAANPGLIYDMSVMDYVPFLCSMGYNNSSISRLLPQQTSCPKTSSALNLNLPSIAIPNLKEKVIVSRIVTNVGPTESIYRAVLHSPSGIKVAVTPQLLSFNRTVKSIEFKVTFSSTQMVQGEYAFGSLTWTDGEHLVRSPIAVRSVIFDSYADM